MPPPLIKFLYGTDFHFRGDIPQAFFPIFDTQWRQYSTAGIRLTAAIDRANIEGCDLFFMGGDLLDQHSLDWTGTPEEKATAAADRLVDALAITDTFNGDGIGFVLGNHERELSNNTSWTIADYWTAVEDGHNHVTRENKFIESGDDMGYTFDYKDVRFVVMWATIGSVSQDQMDWLYDGLGGGVLETTTLPCVLMTHALLYPGNNPQTYARVTNHTAMRSLLETAGNVSLVLSGHFHRNGLAEQRSEMINIVNDIVYAHFMGSVLGAENGNSSDTATVEDSSHYVIEIKSLTVGRSRANIAITGYKQGKTGDAIKYLLGSSL